MVLGGGGYCVILGIIVSYLGLLGNLVFQHIPLPPPHYPLPTMPTLLHLPLPPPNYAHPTAPYTYPLPSIATTLHPNPIPSPPHPTSIPSRCTLHLSHPLYPHCTLTLSHPLPLHPTSIPSPPHPTSIPSRCTLLLSPPPPH